MAQLQNADLVIYMGGGLEPWTHEIMPQLIEHGVATVAIADHIPFYVNEEDAHKNDDMNTSHAHDQFDPHIWLDPVIAQEMTRVILSAITSIDPVNGDTYSQNAQNVIGELDAIDQSYRTGLAACTRRDAIISHEAFGYIARRYDINLHPIVGISTTDEPSAKILAELQSEAKEGATHVLAEKNSVQRFAQAVAQDTGLTMLEINSLENGTGDPQKSYGDVMRDNLVVLRTALACK
jgi:zinc transport system substrate-binding protein